MKKILKIEAILAFIKGGKACFERHSRSYVFLKRNAADGQKIEQESEVILQTPINVERFWFPARCDEGA